MNFNYPCPSCGFLVFSEKIGSYEICPICNWEDDPIQLKYPGFRGGANTGSLKDYQDVIISKIPPEVNEYQGYKRHKTWRPLKQDECLIPAQVNTGIDYFHAVSKTKAYYYWDLNDNL